MVYTNFVCENSTREKPCEIAPLNFEALEETWGQMIEFAVESGWKVKGGPGQATLKVWCPACAKTSSNEVLGG